MVTTQNRRRKTLTNKNKQVAIKSLEHPELNRTDCYMAVYKKCTRANAASRASELWKNKMFLRYLANCKAAAAEELAAEGGPNAEIYDELAEALADPKGKAAARVLLSVLRPAHETATGKSRTVEVVIEGTGKGESEARLITRPNNAAEKLSAGKFVADTLTKLGKEATPIATTIYLRDDVRPEKIEINHPEVDDE